LSPAPSNQKLNAVFDAQQNQALQKIYLKTPNLADPIMDSTQQHKPDGSIAGQL
jgi:hypothetical protein